MKRKRKKNVFLKSYYSSFLRSTGPHMGPDLYITNLKRKDTMTKYILPLMLLVSTQCKTETIENNFVYQKCEEVLIYSKLGNTAQDVIYNFLLTIKNKDIAIQIAEKLQEKGLLTKELLEKLKGNK